MGVIPLSGCLFRSKSVPPKAATAGLKQATQADLIDYVNKQAAAIKTMQATVDIDTTVGGEKRGKRTDYQQIRGYVLARKPAMLRMIGLMPVVRNRAFDMVSNGQNFKLWIPPKNRFVEGRNDVTIPNPKQPLENLRPQHIYDALLLPEIKPDSAEIAFMEDGTEIVVDSKGQKKEQPDYELKFLRKSSDGGYRLSRKIVFNRTDLLPDRQIVYDDKGAPATDTRYENYQEYSGIKFPARIEINRPQEEYDIALAMVKLEFNQPLPDDKFTLDQPSGADVTHLEEPRAQAQKN